MAKRWTLQEDQFLAAHFEAVGDWIGQHDLGRPAGAATKRVAALKASGAWDALQMSAAALLAYRIALDLPLEIDIEERRRGRRALAHCKSFFDGTAFRLFPANEATRAALTKDTQP